MSSTAVRDLEVHTAFRASALKPYYDKSWAIVIGINNYQASNIRDLDYGVSDAEGIAQVLVNKMGFSADRVFVVLEPPPTSQLLFRLHSDRATKAVVENLMFTQVPELVGPDDRLLIFFAGHGERRRLPVGEEEIGYLVPSDAEPGQWHTYIDLETIIRAGNLCGAKHVFYILDACYSGLATSRADVRERRYEEDMLTNRARQVLTAGTAKQAVADKGPQGHSVFTWYVLQGLRGEADLFQNGIITGNQLMVYVRDQVARAFGSEQTPDFGPLPGHESGGDFVFVEPGFSAQEHIDLGCALMELGRRIGDSGRFFAAAEQFDTALRISGRPWPEALSKHGEALLAAGEFDKAAKSFAMAHNQGDRRALLPLGMTYAKLRRYDEAIDALNGFVDINPEDINAAWANDFAATLRRTGGGRRYALLIGYGTGIDEDLNDLHEVLVRRFGIHEQDIVLLAGDQATFEAIYSAFNRLAAMTQAHDLVVIFFTGVGTFVPNTNSDFVTLDGNQFVFLPADYRKTILREDLLFELISKIPAREKLLIADVPHFCFERRICQSLGMRFISGCKRNELTYTKEINGKQRGVFTYHLVRHLDQEYNYSLTHGELIKRINASLKEAGFDNVHTVHVGKAKTPVFPQYEPDFLWLYELSFREDYTSLTDHEVAVWRQTLDNPSVAAFPESNLSLARALVARGLFVPALEAIGRAAATGLAAVPALLLLQLRTLIRARRYNEATTFVENLTMHDSDPRLTSLRQAIAGLLGILNRGEKYALLIGIDRYENAELPKVKGVTYDMAHLRENLVSRWGFQADKIVELKNAQASRKAILDELRRFVDQARDSPALFYFSGLGSVDPDGEPMLLGADARQAGIEDISIAMLHEIANLSGLNLVSLIDAGFSVDSEDLRFVDPLPGSGFLYWGFEEMQRRILENYCIGGFSVFPASMGYIKTKKKKSKPFMRWLLDQLKAVEIQKASRAELKQRLIKFGLTVIGNDLDLPLFDNLNVIARMEETFDKIESRPLENAKDLLTKLQHCGRGKDPRLFLELGIVFNMLGLRNSAQRVLSDAASILDSKDSLSLDDIRVRAEAHYYLGHVLMSDKLYTNAVSQFERALADSPGNAKAHYYRGFALQKLIEIDLYQQIEKSWSAYLKLGAPLRHEQEVKQFIEKRQSPQSDS
jgi:uncharacterized caspase-like protein